MVLMSSKRLVDEELAVSMMRIFAARASAELERRQHEQDLKKSEALFRQVILFVQARGDGVTPPIALANNSHQQVAEGISPMVYVATPNYDKFLYVSPASQRILGRSPQEFQQVKATCFWLCLISVI